MENIVKYIVESLVDNPSEVKITSEQESEKVIILKISVDPADTGKIIGKNGRIANAIRTIVKSASSKSGKRFIIKIV